MSSAAAQAGPGGQGIAGGGSSRVLVGSRCDVVPAGTFLGGCGTWHQRAVPAPLPAAVISPLPTCLGAASALGFIL